MNTIMFINKTYIITGAGQGIGFAIAERLASQGAVVFLNDINEELAIEAAKRIRDAGGDATPSGGDAGDVILIRHVVDAAVEKSGQNDGVVAP
ncbi:MAG: SDR family NAD(P)-dependent oxidoreductase, partial [Sphingobacteriales bacterium]